MTVFEPWRSELTGCVARVEVAARHVVHELTPSGLESRRTVSAPIAVESKVEQDLVDLGLASAASRLIRPRLIQAENARLLAGGMWKFVFDAEGDEIVACRSRDPSPPSPEQLAFPWEDAPVFDRLIDITTPGAALFSFFLLASAPMLAVVGALGFDLRPTDRVLVNSRQPFVLEVLERLGVPQHQVIGRDRQRHAFRARELLTALPIRSGRHTPGWALSFARGLFGVPESGKAKRKLYISRERSHGRRIVNANDLESMLAARQFETIYAEELSLQETAALMAETALLLSPHGAGLSNCIWMTEGRVVEVFGQHYTEQYRLLARSAGLNYVPVPGVGPDGRSLFQLAKEERRAELTNRLDIEVDVQALAMILRA